MADHIVTMNEDDARAWFRAHHYVAFTLQIHPIDDRTVGSMVKGYLSPREMQLMTDEFLDEVMRPAVYAVLLHWRERQAVEE
jgi:hypothetical protein